MSGPPPFPSHLVDITEGDAGYKFKAKCSCGAWSARSDDAWKLSTWGSNHLADNGVFSSP